MDNKVIENAIIESATISNAEHGVLSVWLMLNYGGSGQGFGGYSLFSPRGNYDCAGKFIWRCMEVAGVSEWKDIVGKPIRVRRGPDWNAQIEAIGHIIKDIWFEPSIELKG